MLPWKILTPVHLTPCLQSWLGTMWFLALPRAKKKKKIAQSTVQDCAGGENCHSNALPDISDHRVSEDHFDKMGRKVAVVYPEWGRYFEKNLQGTSEFLEGSFQLVFECSLVCNSWFGLVLHSIDSLWTTLPAYILGLPIDRVAGSQGRRWQ